jgi:hypothetical protein
MIVVIASSSTTVPHISPCGAPFQCLHAMFLCVYAMLTLVFVRANSRGFRYSLPLTSGSVVALKFGQKAQRAVELMRATVPEGDGDVPPAEVVKNMTAWCIDNTAEETYKVREGCGHDGFTLVWRADAVHGGVQPTTRDHGCETLRSHVAVCVKTRRAFGTNANFQLHTGVKASVKPIAHPSSAMTA